MPKNKPAPEADDLPGDGGKREEEVATAMDQIDQLADNLDLGDDSGALVAELHLAFLDLMKHQPKPWSALTQAEQRDLSARLEHHATETVRLVAEAIARNGRDAVRCLLVGFVDKGEDMKVELKVKAHDKGELEQAVLGLHRARGKLVMLTVASVEDYRQTEIEDPSEPEQRALGFEAGSDEHPDDDSDLAEAGDPLADLGEGESVNLKTGMIERLVPAEGGTGPAETEDVREATPAELAAERERTADFADAE